MFYILGCIPSIILGKNQVHQLANIISSVVAASCYLVLLSSMASQRLIRIVGKVNAVKHREALKKLLQIAHNLRLESKKTQSIHQKPF